MNFTMIRKQVPSPKHPVPDIGDIRKKDLRDMERESNSGAQAEHVTQGKVDEYTKQQNLMPMAGGSITSMVDNE